MKTLLVMALHPELADSIRAGLNPEMYRILHRTGLEEAEGLLAQGFVDACVVDIELTNMQVVWLLEKVRRRAPRLPLIVYAGARQWEYEEEAYPSGSKPCSDQTRSP
jgi:DNA-binding NtrC family response regulator